MAVPHASIVVVGDEILGGFVQDTNSGWLAQRLRVHGVPLDRIVTVPDDIESIAAAVGDELDRARPRVVLTSGGIGSTPDDVTMAAVARCLGTGLERQPDIAARVRRAVRWHEANGVVLSGEHAESMQRMALVPQGAYLLAGTEGVVPGVAVDVDGGLDRGGAVIVVLPGVPSELRRITTTGVEPVLLAGRGRPDHVVEVAHAYPESMTNPVLDRVGREFPGVHVGSYPGGECLVRLTGPRADVEQAAEVVRRYLADLDTAPGADLLRTAWRQRWSGAAGEGPAGEGAAE